APVLLIIGDSDIVRPEHAVETFRLLGGGVIGDLVGLPRSRLAILPGTTHITLVDPGDRPRTPAHLRSCCRLRSLGRRGSRRPEPEVVSVRKYGGWPMWPPAP